VFDRDRERATAAAAGDGLTRAADGERNI